MKNNNIYLLPSNSNTHLMKNDEWGAVAYLAASQYGVVPAINNLGTAEKVKYPPFGRHEWFTATEDADGNIKKIQIDYGIMEKTFTIMTML